MAFWVFLLAPDDESEALPSGAGEASFRGDAPEFKDNADEVKDSVETEILSLPSAIEELWQQRK